MGDAMAARARDTATETTHLALNATDVVSMRDAAPALGLSESVGTELGAKLEPA